MSPVIPLDVVPASEDLGAEVGCLALSSSLEHEQEKCKEAADNAETSETANPLRNAQMDFE